MRAWFYVFWIGEWNRQPPGHEICYIKSYPMGPLLTADALHFTKRQIVDSYKLKEFVDDNFRFDENGRKSFKQVENIVRKGEIARYEQFLLFSTGFLKDLYCGHVKRGLVWERVTLSMPLKKNDFENSIFSFSNNAFHPFNNNCQLLTQVCFGSNKCFQFRKVKYFVIWLRVITQQIGTGLEESWVVSQFIYLFCLLFWSIYIKGFGTKLIIIILYSI